MIGHRSPGQVGIGQYSVQFNILTFFRNVFFHLYDITLSPETRIMLFVILGKKMSLKFYPMIYFNYIQGLEFCI